MSLLDLLSNTNRNYSIFKHYKGQYYRVLCGAVHTETNEEMIVYQQLYKTINYPEGFIWTRPTSMFYSNIVIDNITIKRFTLVDEYPNEVKNVLNRLDNIS